MYKKVSTDMGFVAREQEILEFWREHAIQKRRQESCQDGDKPDYTVYDGPPTANGKPHIGHILTRAIKDVYPRYKAMKGYNVQFKAGWDTHGLPVELEVEKALGIDGKPQIEAYGIGPFIKKCKESVWKYRDEWEQMSERVGFWADMEHPYVTYDNSYIESEWWVLRRFWDEGLLYKGYKIVPYCPRCGTALSSHEVAQGYKNIKENSVFIRFMAKDRPNTFFAAWTTTPWTLPSNVALCVNPDEIYVLIETPDNGHRGIPACAGHGAEAEAQSPAATEKQSAPLCYYIAERLAERLFGPGYKVLERRPGRELEGLEYEPLLPFANNIIAMSGKKAWYVTVDPFVTSEDGTGIVHMAPAFGEDDARVARRYDLPLVQLVREDGTMPEEAGEFAGLFCKQADPGIIRRLDKDGLLLALVPHEHSYPFCWRCDTPLIYYARHSWFIAMTRLRERLLANNREVNWIPENIGTGRFGNFLENVVDWGLSRERYWGTPLPVWECKDCGHRHLVGSIQELKELSPDCPEDIELHRPYIDRVHLTCPDCGGLMQRVPEVIDCWFDSGAMPFAQFHYPFENQERFKRHFPADFISEALDQTRGWFYSLMAIATGIFDQSPYRNCEVMGLVQDQYGQKMSKHKGNVVDPWTLLDRQGADAVRWYFYTNSNPWLPSRFSSEAVSEGQRRFLGTLWNTFAFYILYAEIDQFDPGRYKLRKTGLGVMDRWILSRLQSLILKVDKGLGSYDVTAAARALAGFVDELSNWYVRRGRERYWGGEMSQDKIDAYRTLYTVLETLCRLAAPFIPFMAESIYQNLVRQLRADAPLSVHLCSFPEADESRIDAELEVHMADVLRVVTLGRAARNAAALKNRQPLAAMYVVGVKLPDDFLTLALDELNIKKGFFVDDAAELEDYGFKPQLKTLGRRFGKKLPALTACLKALDGRTAWRELKAQGFLTVEVDGTVARLEEADLLVECRQIEGLATESERGVTVALDLRLSPELVEEGLMREVVSKVQTMRREAGFSVTDRVTLAYRADKALEKVLSGWGAELGREVLATGVLELDEAAEAQAETIKDWTINGHPCRLALWRGGSADV